MKNAIFLMLFIFLMPLSVQAVELSLQAYRDTVEDIKKIYDARFADTNQPLSYLRKESADSLRFYFPRGESEGILTIKHPLVHNNIRVLQIPHAFFDIDTLDIGQQMFDTDMADVMMVNTQHRYETEQSDMARLRYTLMTAFVEAMITLNRQVHVVQLHGFNEGKRQTIAAQHTDFILSNGTTVPDTYLLNVQGCLRDNSRLLARLYGRDVFELGATINPVGKLLRERQGHKIDFLHVEMPRRIRTALMAGNDNREVFKCLLKY